MTTEPLASGNPAPNEDADLGPALERLQRLGDNWNGYGEKQITEAAVATLRYLHLSPLTNGGVQIDWFTTSGDLVVEVRPDGSIAEVSWSMPGPA